MRLTVRLPKGYAHLDGATATELLHWSVTTLEEAVAAAPVDLDVVLDPGLLDELSNRGGPDAHA